MCEAIGSLIGPCVSRHFNNKKPGCLDATIKIGIPVTIYRFWVMNGKYHAIIVEGELFFVISIFLNGIYSCCNLKSTILFFVKS